MLTAVLQRNLRKSLLQGEPWVYREAVEFSERTDRGGLCRVKDKKGEVLGWAIFSPKGPLALRIISLDSKPPKLDHYTRRLEIAAELRSSLHQGAVTNCFRLLNGEGDLLPGLICDIYADLAVIQFDGQGPFEFWDKNFIADWLLKSFGVKRVFHKVRSGVEAEPQVWGQELAPDELIEVSENNCRFFVDPRKGQKTGFFLDQRENRQYVRSISRAKEVMNLFSYSGGFSVYSGLGGAKRVLSVDIAQGAIDLSQKNWEINGLASDHHEGICADVFDFLRQSQDRSDIVICDPPSLAKAEKHKDLAIQKYVEVFSLAAKRVRKGGHLVLSSCSSHISFEVFYEIIKQALSQARLRGRVLRISGQGADHPFPHACPELRYLKFADILLES